MFHFQPALFHFVYLQDTRNSIKFHHRQQSTNNQ